ncbi:MAG: hypothetical protein WCT31_00460 [Candidatus Micrarchaeia archaeon]
MHKFHSAFSHRFARPITKALITITLATAVPMLESCSRTEPKAPEPVSIYIDQNGKPVSPPKDLLIVRLDEEGNPMSPPSDYIIYKVSKLPKGDLPKLVDILNNGTEGEQKDAAWEIAKMDIDRQTKVDILLTVYERDKVPWLVTNTTGYRLKGIFKNHPTEWELSRIKQAYERANSDSRWHLLDTLEEIQDPLIRQFAVDMLSDPGDRLLALRCLQHQKLDTPTIKILEKLLYDELAGWDAESTQDVLTELLDLLRNKGIIPWDACNYKQALSTSQDQKGQRVGMSRSEALDCKTKFSYPKPFDSTNP